jgi:NitT/TauT family transport system substrate-binding protein
MKRRIATGFRALLKTAAAVALTAALVPIAVAQPREKLSVVLDFTPWGIHAAMHLAKQKGWFDQAGLDVDVQDGKGTLPGLQLVAVGQVDVGAVQTGPMALAREKGLPLIAIAGFARRGDLAVIVAADSKLDKAQDLAGKKLVCFTGSPWVPFIDSFRRAAKMSEQQFAVTMVAPPAMVASYASGDADGFLSLAPFGVPLVAKTRPGKAILAENYGVHFPSYGLVTNEATLKKRPEALRKLVQVQIRAWDYIYQSPANLEEAVQAIIAQRPTAKLDPDLLRGQIAAYRDFFETPNTKGKRTGWQSEADWAKAISSMESAGAIKPGQKPSDFFTNALVD